MKSLKRAMFSRRAAAGVSRPRTPAPVITNPQVGSVGNSRRKSTSANGAAGRFRHMLVGCAWVSTADQNPDDQIDALLRAGIDRDNIHVDTTSGAKASRPKLDLVLQLLKGDRLKVIRLDRLSRSVLHLVTPRASLRERSIALHVIEQGIDTSTMEGRAMFGMLSVLAELQRELIVANTNHGLASARARGWVHRAAGARAAGAHPRCLRGCGPRRGADRQGAGRAGDRHRQRGQPRACARPRPTN